MTRINLENVMLRGKKPGMKDHDILQFQSPEMWRRGKATEAESRSVVARG